MLVPGALALPSAQLWCSQPVGGPAPPSPHSSSFRRKTPPGKGGGQAQPGSTRLSSVVTFLQAPTRVVARRQEDELLSFVPRVATGTGLSSRPGWAGTPPAHRAAFPAGQPLCCSFRMSSSRFICSVSSWDPKGPL